MLKNKIKSKKISPSILAIIILILLLVCAFVLFFEINDYRNVKDYDIDLYYYHASQRIDFTGKASTNSKDRLLSIQNNNVLLTSSPLYFKNDNSQMVLASNMEIIFPYKNSPMYKLGRFSNIYYKGSYLYINSEAGIGRLYDCFLYDGEDLYVFLENTSLFVDGVEYKLNPMSFVEATNGQIQIYDKLTDTATFIESHNDVVTAYTDEYSINLSMDTFTYGTGFYLLIKNIEGLDFYEF